MWQSIWMMICMNFIFRCYSWLFEKLVVVSYSWINGAEPILMWPNWLLTDRLNLPYSCICVLSLSLRCGERVCSELAQIQVASQLYRWYEGNVVACARPKWCSLAHAYRRTTKLSNHGSHPLIPWYVVCAMQWHAFIQYFLYNKKCLVSFILNKCLSHLGCKYWNRTYKHKDTVCAWLYLVLDRPMCLHLILPKTAPGLGLHGNHNPPCLISV